ncbi:DNA mismatch repair protein spel1 [Brevipalpus obovatus]|uniref:DNA mismatch repair protein spel1 n=1 Tax=Brevipalpus obovatus TaxID=246614 RepID=UPI003D9DC63A
MDLDNDEQTLEIPLEADFLSFYRKLPEQPSATVRIFDRKDFFTLHDKDALLVASEIIKTQEVIKYLDGVIPSLSLGMNKLEMILRELLIVRNYRVEIYQKPKNLKNALWKLVTRASPGNLGELEDMLYGGGEHNNGLASIRIVGNDIPQIGFCHIDSIERVIRVLNFQDNSFLSTLESILVQCSPKEIIVGKNFRSSGFFKRFEEITSLNKTLVSEVQNQIFSEDSSKLSQTLSDLLSPKSEYNFLDSQPNVVAALSAAIDYLSLKQTDGGSKRYRLHVLDCSFVRLDTSAIKALDLFPAPGEGGNWKPCSSTYQLLNHCKTLIGQRLLAQWIRQPLTDINHIRERLELVEFFRVNDEIRMDLNGLYLRRAPDLMRMAKKFDQLKANLLDCCKVYDFIKNLPEIRKLLESVEDQTIKDVFIDQIAQSEEDFAQFIELVKSTIDFNDDREPIIKPEFDEGLGELHEELEEIGSKADQITSKITKKLGIEAGKIKLEVNSQTGYGLRVTKKEEKLVRASKGIQLLDRNKKDAVRFTTDDLQNLSSRYVEIRSSYDSQQKELMEKIIQIAATYSIAMRNLSDTIAKLDVIVSFAIFARSGKCYVKPEILPKGSGKIIMKQVRHPCIEAQPDSYFVPNDVHLDANEHKFYLVTGPNMGGKSTYIRSAALSILLAQIGCFIPAESATISIVDGIHTRVGSSDYQIKGVSTFMAEMIETSSILKSATENSFVIIDELGRGTSTYDGFGLSWQISLHIATQIKSYCFFATHFHELTELSKENPSIGTLHVRAETSSEGLCFLYKVEKGACDQSFGIHVAKLAQFPDSIIELAEERVKELEGFSGTNEKTREMREYIISQVKQIGVDSLSDGQLVQKINEIREHVSQKYGINF